MVPTLAVAITSSDDRMVQTVGRLLDYMDAGVPPVWQAFPKTRHVLSCKDGKVPVFRRGDLLTAESILPGFLCPVADLFPPPANPAG